MTVNNMEIVDSYTIINALHNQVTGASALAPTNTSEFVTQATATLQAGVDTTFNALTQMVGNTVFAVRSYSRKFRGLERSNTVWGAITRKISYADKAITDTDNVYHPTDATTVDMYKINKPEVLETRFYGSMTWEDHYTVFAESLKIAFSGPEEFGRFVTGLVTHWSNVWEQYMENVNRATLANFIGAKNAVGGDGVVHLLTEYNTLTGLELTATDVYKPANVKPFFEWVRARVNTIGREFAERSQKYQVKVQGKNINRHTPTDPEFLKMYLYAPALDIIDTMVNTEAYHNEPLAYGDVEGVTFWQSIQTPGKVSVTPSYIAANGTVQTGEAAEIDDIFGVIFDRDAVGTNVYDYSVENTPYNAAGKYYNTWMHARIRTYNDLTEKGVLLLLD